jgi:hypothetical protein
MRTSFDCSSVGQPDRVGEVLADYKPPSANLSDARAGKRDQDDGSTGGDGEQARQDRDCDHQTPDRESQARYSHARE